MPKDDFETWLTYLAADQPWLSERDILLNRAAMLRVVQELRRVLDEAEERSRESSPPDWLLQLAARWHRDQSPVLTLNYDTIIEAAHLETVLVRSQGRDEPNYVSYSELYPIQISKAWARSAMVPGSSPYPTFKLFKLHGSVSWFYSGRTDFYGESIYDGGVRPWKSVSDPRHHRRAADAVNDKVPLIVPPTSGKSAFFNNETVRAQWRLAEDALHAADRIYFLGYSMPKTDELMRFMIGTACAGKAVLPVNTNVEIGKHYQELLPDSNVSTEYVGAGGLAAFVKAYDGPAWEKPIADL